MSTRAVRFLVPEGVDDPVRVSGGNVYDREVRDGLRGRGWTVEVIEVRDGAHVAAALERVPDDALVLIDGLVGGWGADALAAEAERLRLVVLAHMVVAAFADASETDEAAEKRMLRHARRVIVTSRWAAAELARRGLADPARVAVAAPGVHPAEPSGDEREDHVLCVGVVAPHKGQDLLLAALARLGDLAWSATVVGSMAAAPDYAERIAAQAAALRDRVRLTGVRVGDELDGAYRRAGLVVAPSRVESSGMAIAEARARGIPVIAAETGGIPDTVAGGGAILVPPDDPVALAAALRAWLTDPALRERLRAEALRAREHLPRWDDTVSAIAAVLEAA